MFFHNDNMLTQVTSNLTGPLAYPLLKHDSALIRSTLKNVLGLNNKQLITVKMSQKEFRILMFIQKEPSQLLVREAISMILRTSPTPVNPSHILPAATLAALSVTTEESKNT